MKLMILDGNSIVNRAFYGIKLLTTKDGRFTNAIVGFMNILLKLEAEEKPDEVAVEVENSDKAPQPAANGDFLADAKASRFQGRPPQQARSPTISSWSRQ